MNSQALCFLLVIFIPGFAFMESLEEYKKQGMDKCKEQYDPPIYDHALINHVVWVLTAEKEDLCLIECNLDDDCVSYNVAPSNKTQGWFHCELSSSDFHMSPNDLVEKPGFTYRGIKDPCNPNPCKGPKSVCERSVFTSYKSHVCVCPSGYYNPDCQDDEDECAFRLLNNCKGPGVKCVNTIGSFHCACKEGYVGDGIKCEKTASWIKINQDPVCVGVIGNNYGAVVVPFDANVKQIKLVHLSGSVFPYGNPVTAGNWGDKRFPVRIFFVVTDKNNKKIAPYPGYPMPVFLYFTVDNITVSSPELIFPTIDPPLALEKDDQLRVWFTYDLYDFFESGTTYSESCADMYIYV